jgi:sugar phosphate isomerase/epimerase
VNARDSGLLIGMTIGFPRRSAEDAADLLATLGLEAVEIHLLQLGPGLPGAPVLEGHASALGEALRERGLVVSTLNGAGATGFEPHQDWDGATEELARQLRLASALGSPRLLCWDGRLRPEPTTATASRRLADCIDAARERSRLTNPPVVSVELHPFTFALDRHALSELAEELLRVDAGICLDFCHFGVSLGPGFASSLDAQVLAAVNHVHFADTDCATSELHFPPGRGILDLESIMSHISALEVAVAWDLFGWPAPQAAIRESLSTYVRFVRERAAA